MDECLIRGLRSKLYCNSSRNSFKSSRVYIFLVLFETPAHNRDPLLACVKTFGPVLRRPSL
jgi:hypothetical protein